MARWDSSSAKYEGYENVLNFMKGIQSSDMFKCSVDLLTSNRIHVLMEIQSLWEVLPKANHSAKKEADGENGDGVPILKGSGSSNLRVDDQNNAFSRTYNHHVAPELEDIVVNVVRKLHENKKKE